MRRIDGLRVVRVRKEYYTGQLVWGQIATVDIPASIAAYERVLSRTLREYFPSAEIQVHCLDGQSVTAGPASIMYAAEGDEAELETSVISAWVDAAAQIVWAMGEWIVGLPKVE
ncbi:MAG: hypothetical protein ACR2PL_07755 [Dehalococcoidia bacterium]